MTNFRILTALGALAFGPLLQTSCGYYVPTVRNDTPASLVIQTSENHRFLDRVAYIDEATNQLVVYGKVHHEHERCTSEGHVSLVVTEPDGRVWARQSIPIAYRGGRRGWYGASFRTRIDGVPPASSRIHLSFHDAECSQEEAFNCGESDDTEPPQGPK